MPSETNGTPTDTAELVARCHESLDRIASIASGKRKLRMSIPANPQHDDDLFICDTLRRAAAAIARQGEAQEIGEFVIRHTAGWQVLTVSHDPAAYDEVRFKIVFGKNGVVCGPTLLSAIRSATTPQTKETPNA